MIKRLLLSSSFKGDPSQARLAMVVGSSALLMIGVILSFVALSLITKTTFDIPIPMETIFKIRFGVMSCLIAALLLARKGHITTGFYAFTLGVGFGFTAFCFYGGSPDVTLVRGVVIYFAPVLVSTVVLSRKHLTFYLLAIAAWVLALIHFTGVSYNYMGPSLLFFFVGLGVAGVMAWVREQGEVEVHNEIRMNEKLSQMGMIASGISHEINNPLAIALGMIRRSRKKLDDPSKVGEVAQSLDRSLESLNRIKKIIVSVSNLARNQSTTFELDTPLIPLIEGVGEDMRETFPNMDFEFHYPGEHRDQRFRVFGNGTEIRQILTNLCRNALHAMENAQEKKILFTLDYSYPHWSLKLEDTGQGLPAHILERLGGAFVSKGGGGMGLGLHLSFALAKKNQGELRYHHREGRGALFELVLKDSKVPHGLIPQGPVEETHQGWFCSLGEGAVLFSADRKDGNYSILDLKQIIEVTKRLGGVEHPILFVHTDSNSGVDLDVMKFLKDEKPFAFMEKVIVYPRNPVARNVIKVVAPLLGDTIVVPSSIEDGLILLESYRVPKQAA